MRLIKKSLKKIIIVLHRCFILIIRASLDIRRMSDDTLKSRILKISHAIERRLVLPDEPNIDFQILSLNIFLREYINRGLKKNEIFLNAVTAYVEYTWHLNAIWQHPANISETVQQDLKTEKTSYTCDLCSAIMERRSVRVWKHKTINLEEIKSFINIAKWAPSSCNRQAWKLMFIQEEEKKKELTKYFPKTFYIKADLILLVLIDKQSYPDKETHFSYLDSGAFIQNLLLLLHQQGYGSCWVGFKQWGINNIPRRMIAKKDSFYRFFTIPENFIPVSLIAVGYPDMHPKKTSRKKIEEFII